VLDTRRVRSVILDHHLSGGNGGSFLDQRGHDLPPVILVSGLGGDVLAEIQATRSDQVVGYLTKPVLPRLLIDTVRATLTGD
jgi:DNA-binding response OmpR family regulator